MRRMSRRFSYWKHRGMSLVSQISRLLPIKQNRIVCISHMKNQYSDSPMYISEWLLSHVPGEYEIIWLFKEPEKFTYLEQRGIKVVKHHSVSDFYYTNTAKVFITSLFGPSWYLARRPGKLVIDTTHGVAYKSLLTEFGNASDGVDRFALKEKCFAINRCNLCLSGNAITTNVVYRKELGYRGRILEKGLPRNDILLSDTTPIRADVLKRLGIDAGFNVALFMPTWRKDQNDVVGNIDFHALVKELERCQGGIWKMVLRMHHLTSYDYSQLVEEYADCLIDATRGFDSQELICSANLLITDYSSVVWDAALRDLPILLFQPDCKKYEAERGFNVHPSEWGLFNARTSDELIELVQVHTLEELREASRSHLAKFGNCESGKATEEVCRIILDFATGRIKLHA